jgi:hypothetical protein
MARGTRIVQGQKKQRYGQDDRAGGRDAPGLDLRVGAGRAPWAIVVSGRRGAGWSLLATGVSGRWVLWATAVYGRWSGRWGPLAGVVPGAWVRTPGSAQCQEYGSSGILVPGPAMGDCGPVSSVPLRSSAKVNRWVLLPRR